MARPAPPACAWNLIVADQHARHRKNLCFCGNGIRRPAHHMATGESRLLEKATCVTTLRRREAGGGGGGGGGRDLNQDFSRGGT